MDEHPEQPSDDAPELEASDVGDRLASSDRRERPLVPVLEHSAAFDRRTSSNLPRKGFSDLLSHLKCGRGESWDCLPIALDVGQVSYGENV